MSIQQFSGRATISATVAFLANCWLSSFCYASTEVEPALTNEVQYPKHHASKERKSSEHTKAVTNHDWIKGHIVIKAPTSTVWYSVHEERKSDPDMAYSKLLEQTNNFESTLEQKFVLLPMIGTAVCVMKNTEIPFQRIDYRLLKSDHFKVMEGSWVLTPMPDGRSTMLELSSRVDLGMPIPRCFVNAALAKKIDKRLHNVKVMAEGMHTGVAAQAVTH